MMKDIDQTKIVKLLRLMKLMTGNTTLSIEDLAAKMGTTTRTVYRYIDTMRDAGLVVNKLYGNVYQMGKMSTGFPNLAKFIYFTEEEAYILNNMIENLSVTNTLRKDLKRKLYSVYDCTSIANYTERCNNAPNIEALVSARDNKRKVILKNYQSGHSNNTRDRIVEPFDFTSEMIDVIAWDIEAGENRIFKIARVDEVEVLDETWEHETDHLRLTVDVFRMSGQQSIPVRLRLNTRAKSLLLEEFPLAGRNLTKDGSHWILDTTVTSLEGVGRFVIGLAADIKVIDSPELKGYIQAYVKDYVHAAIE
ncbi:MAG: transcriptional regulator [Candidatus Cryptobacteroides sp.]|nr:transcriptional regulator [Bacteroidales bacterium]MDY6158134.1 transcriptional regulator [Candidatus Cryptobacteroides sp.]